MLISSSSIKDIRLSEYEDQLALGDEIQLWSPAMGERYSHLEDVLGIFC